MAYNWTAKDRKEEATNILKAGLDANPSRYVMLCHLSAATDES